MPIAQDAITLRRWDDQAKSPGQATPSVDDCLALPSELRLTN